MGNTGDCADQYSCMTALYLLSILAHKYNIIIDRVVGATGHGIEVVDGLNDTKNKILSMLMKPVQPTGATDWCSSL